MNTVGKKITQLRELLDMKQKELATKASITEASLSRYENGLREPKADILSKIAKALGTTTSYLIGEESFMNGGGIEDSYEENRTYLEGKKVLMRAAKELTSEQLKVMVDIMKAQMGKK